MAGKYQTFFPAILEFKEFVIFFFVHCKTNFVAQRQLELSISFFG